MQPTFRWAGSKNQYFFDSILGSTYPSSQIIIENHGPMRESITDC